MNFAKPLLGFVTGAFAVLLLLSVLPRPLAVRLATLKGDGQRIVEVHKRITESARPIDIAFIGTSHTMHGIDDRGIEENLKRIGVQANVTNLGTNWPGRDMHLFLVSELLAKKRPEIIVLEIDEHEPPYGHALMPYVASLHDMFCCAFWLQFNFPKMFLLFLKEQLYGGIGLAWPWGHSDENRTKVWDFGWTPVDRIWNLNETYRPSIGEKLESFLGSDIRTIAYNQASGYGKMTVTQIATLARSKHVDVIFLYLAEYGFAAKADVTDLSFYSNIGSVFRPSTSVVADRLNWFDFAHLNEAGARKLVPDLSAALAGHLGARLRNGLSPVPRS